MWILNWVPDIAFHLILAIGVLGLIASFFLGFIPFIFTYKVPVQIISILLIVCGVWFEGVLSANDVWEQKVSQLEVKLAQAEKQSSDLNTLLIEQMLENEKKMIEVMSANKKYLDSIRVKVDKECKIGSEVINIHNSSAKNQAIK
jgi:hypothetical protein